MELRPLDFEAQRKACLMLFGRDPKTYTPQNLFADPLFPTQAEIDRTDLSGMDLQGVRFDRLNLTDKDLSWANLKDASFVNAVLTGANFSRAYIDGAHFHGAEKDAGQLMMTTQFRHNSITPVVPKFTRKRG